MPLLLNGTQTMTLDSADSANPTRPTALVTGAGRRIGREIALALARRGYDIAVHYRSSSGEALDLVAAIEAIGRRAAAVQADLADMGDVATLVTRSAAALGPITLLVNNASEFGDDTIVTMTPQTWAQHLDTNFKAPVFLAQALYTGLPDAVTGNVVNIIDQRVLKLSPEFFSYTLSKAGLWTATRMLAQAMAPRVRVNAIGPGPVLRSIHQSETDFAAEQTSTILRRGASPQEITAGIGFILDAPAMTGQMIALDGGQHLVWN
jgi:NAD(P)-dependent dehydrogenase (short-subunit alcohol dehydrogenase family)